MATDDDATAEPQELRRAYDGLKENFSKLEAEHRNLLATTTFKEAKLNPKHAELFLKVNGDQPITLEAATKFAEDYGLAPMEETPPGQEANPPPANQQLAGMSGAATPGSGIGNSMPVGPKMSLAEFETMLSKDKNAALKAYAEGRVEHAPGNVSVREAVDKGLIAG